MKAFVKKLILSFAYFLYRAFWKYPRIMNLFHALNDRLHLVSGKREAQQVYRSTVRGRGASWKDAAAARPLRPISELKIAAVLDEFSYNCYKYECRLLPVDPDGWLEVFEAEQPDVFFCESAWSGVDSVARPWQGRVYTSDRNRRETREALLSILDYCKDHRIPTVFWNKEDPSHFDDKAHNFVDTAVKFDYVFTTDSACVERYRREYGHKNVFALMFATQPWLFNPIETYERTDDIVFAGSWYAYHEQRCRQMETIFDRIITSGRTLVIYNRYDESDPNHIFPDKYKPYLRPALPYDQLSRAYKGSRIALNITTVTDSDTMFARRIFELMSSNTFVLTNHTRGIERLFGDDVLYAEREWSFEGIDEKRERNLYRVLAGHTYDVRLKQILDDIGFPYQEQDESIGLYYVVNDAEEIARALDDYQRVAYVQKTCTLVLTERFEPMAVPALAQRYAPAGVGVLSLHDVKQYGRVPQPSGCYFLFPGPAMDAEFPGRAALHFSYLEGDVSVHAGTGRKYVFEEIDALEGRLFRGEAFAQTLQALASGRPCGLRSLAI